MHVHTKTVFPFKVFWSSGDMRCTEQVLAAAQQGGPLGTVYEKKQQPQL